MKKIVSNQFDRGLELLNGSRWSRRFADSGSGLTNEESVYTIQREDEIRFLGAEYASLYAKANATAFQSGMWLDHLYRMLVPARGAKPCIITIRTAGEQRLVGLLPMVRRRRMLARTVEYADLGVSDYAAPVIDSEHQRLILADPSVASRVRAALGGFDLLRIERVPDDPAPLGISSAVRGPRSTSTVRISSGWTLTLSPGMGVSNHVSLVT